MIGWIERTACPVCGQPKREVLVEKAFTAPPLSVFLERYYNGRVPLADFDSTRYQLCHCATCSSLYQGYILDSEGLTALYEEWIAPEQSLYKRHHAALGQPIGYARQAMQIIKAVQRPAHEIRVLDFGMGWGTWLLMIRAFGMQAIGLELSAERQAYARSVGLQVLSPDELGPGQVDFINAEQVFEHLAAPAQAIQQCYEWLTPGGWLRIAVPNSAASLRRVRAGAWQASDVPTQPLEHLNSFTPASLRHLAHQVHLEVIPAPLVIPAFGINRTELKQSLGVLGLGLAERLGFYQSTVVWLQKR
jgi:SAM-dependent methyltransferase